MVEETLAQLISRLLDERGWSDYKFAQLSGIDRAYVGKLKRGEQINITIETAEKLGRGFGMEPELFMSRSITRISKPSLKPKLSDTLIALKTQVGDALRQLDDLQVVEIGIRGTLPTQESLAHNGVIKGIIYVPKSLLGEFFVSKGLYGLSVANTELEAEGIHEGETVIVDTTAEFAPGKLYVVRENRIYRGRRLDNQDEVEIVGRIIAAGRWSKF